MLTTPIISFGQLNNIQMCGDSLSRQYLRDRIETSRGLSHDKPDSFIKTQVIQDKGIINSAANSSDSLVDLSILQKLGKYYAHERTKDKLYTGANLFDKKDGIRTAKEAGIKSILSLEGGFASDIEKAKEIGLNAIGLRDIGNKTLGVFSIYTGWSRDDILRTLIDKPETWVTENKDGTKIDCIDKQIEDIQTFIDLLDGKNKDYPYPIYYGCQWGTNRTWAWTQVYKILKDSKRSEPLSKEIVDKLAEVRDIIGDE